MLMVRRNSRLRVIGVVLLLAATGASVARGAELGRVAPAAAYAAHVAEAAQRFRVPAAWIEAVLRAESAGDAHAVSPVGAMGLMQIMPGTWAGLRVRYGLGSDPFEPRDNILAGTAYLREMFDRYGDVGAMLAAYNAGPDRTDDYLAFGRPLPAETRAYVATIAPVLGAAPLPDRAASHGRAPDWRQAPLFVGRAVDAPDAQPESGATFDGPVLLGGADAAEAPTPGIFVPRSADGVRQ